MLSRGGVWLRWVRVCHVLPSTGDVLVMSVVRGVCGVCDMSMCLTRGVVGG